jgi:hypothetical protein
MPPEDPSEPTAERFKAALLERQSADELRKIQRYFKSGAGEYGEGDQFMGVRMGDVFALAKTFIDMAPAELEVLLDDPIHEVRAGALSIMDKQARRRKTPEPRRKELYGLYLRRHDRINNWDLVDLAAPFVVGGYLFDKDRAALSELACPPVLWERRTAITATAYFIRQGEAAETFAVAALLVEDPEDLIHKATGGWLRAAGGVDPAGLRAFLATHAATMPRTMLRYALEHFEADERAHYKEMRNRP